MNRKITSALIASTLVLSMSACQTEKKTDNEIAQPSKVVSDNSTSKIDEDALSKMDKILSPFEDMTEYALANNEKGIAKSLTQVLETSKNSTFEKYLTPESIDVENEKINALQVLVEEKKYQEVALASTALFQYNVSNFIDAEKVPNQIKIEHLDYLGFQVLAMLNQNNIDWDQMEITTSNAQSVWDDLKTGVSDGNLIDTFNSLFDGLHLSIQNKDEKMTSILSSMVLSLVDVLENSF